VRPAVIGALALATTGAVAQEPPRFPSEVRLVVLDVTVTRDDRPVRGLTAADFQVFDSGVLQAVETARLQPARVHAVLLLDTSGSVAGEKLEGLERAARSFLEGLDSDDTVTLLSFAYRVRLLSGRGVSPEVARAALGRLAAGGTTALYDAVAAATALADPRRGRPVVVVFSDGADRLSWLSERHVLAAARNADVVIHAVAFAPERAGRPDRASPMSKRKLRLEGSPGFLERLTRTTGGRVWYADDPRGLGAAFSSVLDDVRGRYVLRYQPTGVPVGGFHPVRVTVRGKGLTVRCRPGYQADPARTGPR
jgi:VWFA-related protein